MKLEELMGKRKGSLEIGSLFYLHFFNRKVWLIQSFSVYKYNMFGPFVILIMLRTIYELISRKLGKK